MFLSYKVTKNICHSVCLACCKEWCHKIVIKTPIPNNKKLQYGKNTLWNEKSFVTFAKFGNLQL